jgi:hypothetical protein
MYTSGPWTRVWESLSPTAEALAVLNDGREVGILGYVRDRYGLWAVVAVRGPDNRLIVGYVWAAGLRRSPDPIPLQGGPGGPELDPKAFASAGAGTKA